MLNAIRLSENGGLVRKSHILLTFGTYVLIEVTSYDWWECEFTTSYHFCITSYKFIESESSEKVLNRLSADIYLDVHYNRNVKVSLCCYGTE